MDNGISAVYAAQLCKEEGIDLIITDHHLLAPEVPEAYAIIDQKQESCTFPYDDVCGAQIAWYLIASLKNAFKYKDRYDGVYGIGLYCNYRRYDASAAH